MLENSSYIVGRNTLLGIDITINDDKIIKVEIKDQLNGAMDTFVTYGGETITDLTCTKTLRIVNEECKKLIGKRRTL